MNCVRDLVRTRRIEEEACGPLLYQPRMIADGTGKNRSSTGKSLANSIRKSLIERWVNQRIVRAEEFGYIPPFSQPFPLIT